MTTSRVIIAGEHVLELFRLYKRVHKIHEQKHCNDESDYHKMFPFRLIVILSERAFFASESKDVTVERCLLTLRLQKALAQHDDNFLLT